MKRVWATFFKRIVFLYSIGADIAYISTIVAALAAIPDEAWINSWYKCTCILAN